jgi:pyruvate dehydrogenase E2 component (dihydrolipoamide acetyltransferase)
MANVTMPQLGETVIEGTITKWLKSEGESVAQDEPLFEISTDKVDTEVPSPAAGTLTKILVPEGQTVAVGTDLAQIDGADAAGDGSGGDGAQAKSGDGDEAQDATASDTATGAARGAATGGDTAAPVQESAPVETPQVEPAAGDAGGAATPDVPGRSRPTSPAATPAASAGRAAPAASAERAAPAGGPEGTAGPRSQILSPLVRRLAAEHDVDLSQVSGTGTGGRITKNDVLDHIDSRESRPTPAPAPAQDGGEPAAPPPATSPTPLAGDREEIVPVSTLRRAIAGHMAASVQTSARAWTAVEVNLENVVRLRDRTKEAFLAREGFKLTYMPFVTRAVIDALLAYPTVNAELRGDEIVIRHYVNMGIAVSIEGGLIVPVVKGADSMNLMGLARAINDVAVRARGRQLQPDEVHGHTFSITNPGPFGSLISVPIINQPNTGILSFDAVQQRPVVIDDAIAIRHMAYLSMSWDHRTIDGAVATQFLARVKHDLENWDFAEDLRL